MSVLISILEVTVNNETLKKYQLLLFPNNKFTYIKGIFNLCRESEMAGVMILSI